MGALNLLCVAVLCVVSCGQPQASWMDRRRTPRERSSLLLREMTEAEKLSMLEGRSFSLGDEIFYTGIVKGNYRLGIPELRLNEGAQGYVDKAFPGTSTAWPCALAVASTWDVSIVRKWGEAIGDEFYQKGANIMLGPAVNLAVNPLYPGNFEFISGEDGYLGNLLVQNFVEGVQSVGVIVNAKHLTNRMNTLDDRLDQRSLHELYYQPFYGAVEAGVGSLMCTSVNSNGFWSCDDAMKGDLNKHFEFGGFIMNKWWVGNSDITSAELKKKRIAIEKSFGPEADEYVHQILMSMFDMGIFDNTNPLGSHDVDVTSQKNELFARQLSGQSQIILKNSNNLLPLSLNEGNLKIALIGHAAVFPVISGGTESRVHARQTASPYEGLLSAMNFGSRHQYNVKCTPVLKLEENMTMESSLIYWVAVESADDCSFHCSSVYSCKYFIFDSLKSNCGLLHAHDDKEKKTERQGTLLGECVYNDVPPSHWQCNSNNLCLAFSDGKNLSEALEISKSSDVVIIAITYPNDELTDSGNIASLSEQYDLLVSTISAVKRPVIVASTSGSAYFMPWLDNVDAIIHSFFAGQEYGHGLADVIFGKVSPSARLPITFPAKEHDLSVENSSSGPMFFGYRQAHSYDGIRVTFPFGHGLSYTTFDYKKLIISAHEISCRIANSGHYSGSEMVQLYIRFPLNTNTPQMQLRGFQKTDKLEPGQEAIVIFTLFDKDYSVWNLNCNDWNMVQGPVEIFIGSSSSDIRLTGILQLGTDEA